MHEQKTSSLMAMAQRQHDPLQYPGYHPAGSRDAPEMLLSKALTEPLRRYVTCHYTPSLKAMKPAKFLVVQSEPGVGKTQTVSSELSRLGCDVIDVPGSSLAGEREGAPIVILDEVREAVHAISRLSNGPPIVTVHDFDLSAAVPADDRVTTTINTQLLISRLQDEADNGLTRTADGVSVPFVLTGNDFTPARGSLLRNGRAEFVTFAPSLEEKTNMVAHLFGLELSASLKAVVRAHKNEPMAFWAAVKAAAFEGVLDELYAEHGFSPPAIEAALVERGGVSFDINTVRGAATLVASRRAKRFLK